MPSPREITLEHINALGAVLDDPRTHIERCVERLSYLASDGQAWTRTLQVRIPLSPTSPAGLSDTPANLLWSRLRPPRDDNRQWYPVSLGVFKRRRLPDLEVRDCNGVRLNLLTRRQHGEILERVALGNYLQGVRPGFSASQLTQEAQFAYAALESATRDLFTSAALDGATGPVARVVAALFDLYEAMGAKPRNPNKQILWRLKREREFFTWASQLASTTQYLCWVRARPGDVVNLSVSYTTADARDEFGNTIRWTDVLSGNFSTRIDARLAVYRAFALAPLQSTFSVPGEERGASYYFTLKPPDNTLVTFMDWQDGNSLERDPAKRVLKSWLGKRRQSRDEPGAAQEVVVLDTTTLEPDHLDCADHVVHFHSDAPAALKSYQPKRIRAYLRSVPRAHTQIAAGAFLNVVFLYLVARGRVQDTSSAQWLLLTPAVLLAYIADQQRHYYAMATRAQRAVLWVYLGITIGTLVTVLFGTPQSSDHWGWLATSFALICACAGTAVVAFFLGWLWWRTSRAAEGRRES